MAKETPPEVRQTDDPKWKERQALALHRFYFLIAMLVLIVVFVIGTLYVLIKMPNVGPDGRPIPTNGWFSVDKIVLSGNTQYDRDSVLYESYVVVGQSIFTVDTDDVEKRLLRHFPYYTKVEAQTVGMSEVHIKVTETTSLGVIHDNGTWVTVACSGKAVDREPVTSDMPKGQLYLKGVTLPSGGVTIGGAAMDEESMNIAVTLVSAIQSTGLTDIVEIDMSNRSNIRMNWRGQLDIHLGNASNLTHEVSTVAECIPKLIDMRGEKVTGVLDLTSYSNEALKDQAVFTPSSLISGPVVTTTDDDTTA